MSVINEVRETNTYCARSESMLKPKKNYLFVYLLESLVLPFAVLTSFKLQCVLHACNLTYCCMTTKIERVTEANID